MTKVRDLMEMFCEMMVKNRSVGMYDGAYRCVELATGKVCDQDSRIATK